MKITVISDCGDLPKIHLHVFGHVHERYGVQAGNAALWNRERKKLRSPLQLFLAEEPDKKPHNT